MSKIVLIGAGSAQFGYGTLGEIFASPIVRDSEVWLLDINPQALKTVSDTALAFKEQHNLPTPLHATTDRNKALQGADFVIISIEVGNRFELWEQDWNIPQQYGMRQVYGENGGPGGLFHSLRIIPPILDICQDVLAICPDAYVFNYSNPMSRICTTVQRRFPDLKFIGLCHEVASLERYLPQMLDVPFEQLRLTAGGLNHFSCLLEAQYASSGEDAYGDIRAKAPTFFASIAGSSDFLRRSQETGKVFDTEGQKDFHSLDIEATRQWTERLLFRFVLEQFDLLPITTDSHFGEYLAWAYDVVDHQGILDFYTYYKHMLCVVEPELKLKTKERVIPIIEAIIENSGMLEAAVNIPNRGYIEELPSDIAVEVPARIGKTITGEKLPQLPRAYAGILQNQVAIHHMTAEAVLTKSKQAVVQALLVDPIVHSAKNISQLVEVMCYTQRDYLGYLE